MDRKAFILLHTIIASFIAPVAFMFLLTGGLYTWGIKGDYINATYISDLAQPIEATQDAAVSYVVSELEKLGFSPPTGEPSFRKSENGMSISWTGSNMDLNFSTIENGTKSKIEVKETTLYRKFVQLHKAKGGTTFKVYAAILAISLFLMLVSGYILAWQLPKYRKITIGTSLFGVIFFVIMVWIG